MLTPQRDPTAIKLTTRLAVVISKILVLEAQRVSYGLANAEATKGSSGQWLLAKLSAERQALEEEIAMQGRGRWSREPGATGRGKDRRMEGSEEAILPEIKQVEDRGALATGGRKPR